MKGKPLLLTIGPNKVFRYYKNPLTFNPENFAKETKAARHPYTFLPFGQGPRSCIGMRFATLEIKIGLIQVMDEWNFLPENAFLAQILRRFDLKRTSETPSEVTKDPASMLGTPLQPIFVKPVPKPVWEEEKEKKDSNKLVNIVRNQRHSIIISY